jgi:hypothetical protein
MDQTKSWGLLSKARYMFRFCSTIPCFYGRDNTTK